MIFPVHTASLPRHPLRASVARPELLRPSKYALSTRCSSSTTARPPPPDGDVGADVYWHVRKRRRASSALEGRQVDLMTFREASPRKLMVAFDRLCVLRPPRQHRPRRGRPSEERTHTHAHTVLPPHSRRRILRIILHIIRRVRARTRKNLIGQTMYDRQRRRRKLGGGEGSRKDSRRAPGPRVTILPGRRREKEKARASLRIYDNARLSVRRPQ